MKIKILTILAGPSLSAQPGDVIELDLPTARVLIDGGYAVGMDGMDAMDGHGRTRTGAETPVEMAVTVPAQSSTSPRQRARPAK